MARRARCKKIGCNRHLGGASVKIHQYSQVEYAEVCVLKMIAPKTPFYNIKMDIAFQLKTNCFGKNRIVLDKSLGSLRFEKDRAATAIKPFLQYKNGYRIPNENESFSRNARKLKLFGKS